MSADDLSGAWTGIFNYPRDLPATGFAAVLVDRGGTLSGETVEADGDGTRAAWLEGRREGTRVRFAKTYHDFHDYVIAYDGQVDGAGLEIHGRWEIAGIWAGTFIMIRDDGTAADAETGETVAR